MPVSFHANCQIPTPPKTKMILIEIFFGLNDKQDMSRWLSNFKHDFFDDFPDFYFVSL